jgi:hypothetical protein
MTAGDHLPHCSLHLQAIVQALGGRETEPGSGKGQESRVSLIQKEDPKKM